MKNGGVCFSSWINIFMWEYFGLILFLFVTTSAAFDDVGTKMAVNIATIDDYIGNDPFFEVLQPESLKYTYRLRQARNFGTQFSYPHKGLRLVVADPDDCCSTLYNQRLVSGAVALVTRGQCSFVSKTLQAEKAGAIAVIVTEIDEENDKLYIEMISDETGRQPSIPAFFLLGRNGEFIRNTLIKQAIPEAIINIPLNLTNVSIKKLNQPPWIVW